MSKATFPISVLPFLYVGSKYEAADVQALKALGISFVFNCALGEAHLDPKLYNGSGLHVEAVNAHDHEDYDMTQHLAIAHDFIEKARNAGTKCLLHCVSGINSSGFIAVWYVMRHEKLAFNEAFAMVRMKFENAQRPLLTNLHFRSVLAKMQMQESTACDPTTCVTSICGSVRGAASLADTAPPEDPWHIGTDPWQTPPVLRET